MQASLSLQVKPFGKDGVRLLWSMSSRQPPCVDATPATSFSSSESCLCVVAEVLTENAQDWLTVEQQAKSLPSQENDGSGVMIIRSLPMRRPRDCAWRVRCADCGAMSASVFGAVLAPSAASASSCAAGRAGCRVEDLSSLDGSTQVELLFNILQWYGTVVVDCGASTPDRGEEGDARRSIAESMVLCGAGVGPHAAAALMSIPLRDDAVVFGELEPEALQTLRRRVLRDIRIAPAVAVDGLLDAFPCLEGLPGSKRFTLPNIVDQRLVVGHQGHALTLDRWAKTLDIVGVINLAPDRVASLRDAVPCEAENYVEVCVASDGQPLKDTNDSEEEARFFEALPQILASISKALMPRVGEQLGDVAEDRCEGRVFIHCQQGRSRAASVAVGQLLAWHEEWTLYDAVAFLARRRPEVELNVFYAQALERFATTVLGRPSSMQRVKDFLPKHLRNAGVAREVRDKMLDARA